MNDSTRGRPCQGGFRARGPLLVSPSRTVGGIVLRAIAPRRRSTRSGLQVRVLHRDLVALEGEDIAAGDLDLLAVRRGAGEEPLREPAVARHEVPRVAEVHIGESLE